MKSMLLSPVVPEPISSTLFIVGGATLGFRRFRKKYKK
ncbi:MAG: PEP-CTERM sorting domain-containing protein [Nitrospiraceae bacterium]|nr:MAG: PEP-CTERM sorting domain-containing protein [Nitrospiraceae bacterium]